MINTSVNPTSVYIPMKKNECKNAEFDSAYPVHLNGIIHPDEFAESINNINRVNNLKNTSVKHWMIIYLLFTTVSIVFLFVGAGLTTKSHVVGVILASIGCGILFLIIFVMIRSLSIINKYRRKQLPQAIAKESMKYSSRLPIPCNWRLDISTDPAGDIEYVQEIYKIIIDIGMPNATGNADTIYYLNQDVPEPIVPDKQHTIASRL